MERKREEFEAQGVRLAAISFDTPEILKAFVERKSIGFPLLSDPDSEIIRDFGILNETIPETHQFYGIPHPGEYLIDENGVVKAKFFEERYADRFTAGHVLVRQLGSTPEGGIEKETDHLTIRASASDWILQGGHRVALVVDISMNPKMHVYAPGVEGGYIPISWTMEATPGVTVFEPDYPPSEMLHLPAINETVPVYEGKFRIVADIRLGQPKEFQHLVTPEGNLVLRGALRYQACDDKICYLPQTVPLEWTFQLESHDRTRAPEELRRGR